MKIIEAQEARERLDMATCIGLMREAFTALENGTVLVWKKYQSFSPAARQFIEYIKDAFRA